MIRRIVESSLRLRRLVVLTAAGAIAFAIAMVPDTEVDSLREFGPPMVEVQTDALGLSAEEVEQLITVPLEQDLLVGIPFLSEIESASLPGLSSVVMTFEPGTDVMEARQLVQERLTQAVGIAGLPQVSRPPQMLQPQSSTSRVSMVKLSSDRLTPIEMSVLARWVIGPRLLGVEGVANVATWGNRDLQLQVRVDPERLQREQATLAQIIATAGNALEVSPLSYLEASKPGTGGFIDTPNQRLNVFHEQAITTARQLEEVPLEAQGGTGQGAGTPALGDVTDVVEDHQPLIGDAVCDGGESCLLMVVERFPDANTGEVAAAVDDALDAMRVGLQDLEVDTSLYRPADHVESSLSTQGWALLVGAVLLGLLLVASIWNWRALLVLVGSVATSLAAAVLVLSLTEVTVDLLVVTGLVLGVTAVVHDAVTDGHFLANRRRGHRDGASPSRHVLAVLSETRGSLAYAALIVGVACLPLLLAAGDSGTFLPSIALAYLLAVVTAMAVALVVTPALAHMLTPEVGPQSPVTRRLHHGFDKAAPRLVTRAPVALGVVLGLLGLGVAGSLFLDTDMRPAYKEPNVLVQLDAPPGTSLPRMTAIAQEAVEVFTGVTGVEDATAHVGRAAMSDRIVDVDSGDVWLRFDPEADYDDTMDAVRSAAAELSAGEATVTTYSASRLDQLLGEEANDLTVRIFGDDQQALDRAASDVESSLAGIDGVADAAVDLPPTQPTIMVEVDLERAQDHGVKPGDVRRVAASVLGGITVGHLFQEQKVFDVVVWGSPGVRDSVSDIENLLMDTPGGGHVRLGEVADVRTIEEPSVIRHTSVSSYRDVVVDVADRDPADVAEDVQTAVEGVEFPLEHHAELITGFDEDRANLERLVTLSVVAALGVLLLLQAGLRSWRMGGLVFLMLLASLSGGVLAVLVTGATLSLGSVAGLLGVLGLAARSLVLLVRRYQSLERVGDGSGSATVLAGTRDNLVPVLVATVGTLLLVLPFLVLGVRPGTELLHPMAVAMVGGLISTLVVVLLAAPALYLRFGSAAPSDDWEDEPVAEVPAQRRREPEPVVGALQRARGVTAFLVLPALVLSLSSCGGSVAAGSYVIEGEPAHLETRRGSDVPHVVLTEQAAERIELRTGVVRDRGRHLVVPRKALFVDPHGSWWVYTNPEPLVFVREEVGLVRERGHVALLSDGPPAGTEIVTVGVAELYGTEESVDH